MLITLATFYYLLGWFVVIYVRGYTLNSSWSPIIQLVRNIVEGANVTLSPIRSFVNVVEYSSGLLRQKENAKKK
jgi:hypothetical protein